MVPAATAIAAAAASHPLRPIEDGSTNTKIKKATASSQQQAADPVPPLLPPGTKTAISPCELKTGRCLVAHRRKDGGSSGSQAGSASRERQSSGSSCWDWSGTL
jgi:hypothetical protein